MKNGYFHLPQQEQFIQEMEAENHSSMTEFTIWGLTEDPVLGVVFFVLFLGIDFYFYFYFYYIVTLVGNFRIIVLIRISPQLHTPMYLFLSHLPFVDIVYSTSVSVLMLMELLGHGLIIPVAGCEAQLCITVSFGSSRCFLLAAMAYDHYVSICSPLLYSTHMSSSICFLLLGTSYVGGCMNG